MYLSRGLHPDLVRFDSKSMSSLLFSSLKCRILMKLKDKFHSSIRLSVYLHFVGGGDLPKEHILPLDKSTRPPMN